MYLSGPRPITPKWPLFLSCRLVLIKLHECDSERDEIWSTFKLGFNNVNNLWERAFCI